MLRIERLFIHPVKSLRGIEVDEAEVRPRGFQHDRRFCVVDPSGTFVSQREQPRMALVSTAIEGDQLRLSSPSQPPLWVPLWPDELPDPWPGAARRTVRVWGDAIAALPTTDEADAWLSAALGAPVSLVRMDADSRRAVDPDYAPGGDEVSFADGYPYLVTSTESLADLARQLPDPPGRSPGATGSWLSMARFRPNIVVAGAAPWAEDRWLRLGVPERGVVLHMVKPCARCTVPNVDPLTAARGAEPLATLARVRRSDRGVLFGHNAIVDHPATSAPAASRRLRVGDRVVVLEEGDHGPAFAVRPSFR